MIKVTSNVDKVLSQLKAYQQRTEEKEKRLLVRLHEIGVDVASAKLMTISYDGDHTTEVLTEPEWISDTALALSVQGDAITFIEFGTGTFYGDMHEKAGEFGFTRGGYGQHRGLNPPWTFTADGRPISLTTGTARIVRKKNGGYAYKTYGNPPNRVLYGTSQELKQKITDIAREVWND